MCCFCWTRRESFHPRFLHRHRDTFYWWLPSWNPVPSNIWTANSFVPEAEPWDGLSCTHRWHSCCRESFLSALDAWNKCSAEVNWQRTTCSSDAIAIPSGCLTSSALPGGERAEHGMWERRGGWSQGSGVWGAVPDNAVWAGGSKQRQDSVLALMNHPAPSGKWSWVLFKGHF